MASKIPPHPFQTKVVAGFGGGVDWTMAPHLLRDDQWADGTGWLATNGYAEVARLHTQLGGTLGAAGFNAVGIAQNPFSMIDRPILIGFVSLIDGIGAIKVYKVNQTNGVATEITHDGTDSGGGVTAPAGSPFALMGIANMADDVILSFGASPTSGTNSLIRAGSALTTYQTIKPTKPLTAAFLCGFGQHLVAAHRGTTLSGQRTILISSETSSTIWDEAISNSADEIALGEARSPLLGMFRAGSNALAHLTRDSLYVQAPTGGDPPFTVQEVSGGGGFERPDATGDTGGGFVGDTPFGGFYQGHDDLYLVGSGGGRKGVGRPVMGELRQSLIYSTSYSPQLVWHPRLGVLYVPVKDNLYAFDPLTSAWSPNIYGGPASSGGGSAGYRHAVIHDSSSLTPRHYMLLGQRELWTEALTNDPIPGGFIDTKDFTFGQPPVQMEIVRIKVDWEPLTSASTDAIQVQVCARDHLARQPSGGLLGLDGGRLAIPASTQTLGTLFGGRSELPVRTRGKFTRFRFTTSSGRVRIRGFSFLWRPAGDRLST